MTYGRCQLRVGTVVSSIRLPFSCHLSRILSVPLSFTLYKWCLRLVAVGKIPSASPQIALFSELFDLSIGFFGFLLEIGSSKFSRHILVVSWIKIKCWRAFASFSMQLFLILILFFSLLIFLCMCIINLEKVEGISTSR